MKKLHVKLIAIVVELVVLFSVLAVSSYAWLVLSANPAAEGIQITIGGGNTILVAADVTEEVDGVIYHYPSDFNDTLNFSRHSSYEYLNNLSNLTPVSMADGVNWYLPTYYDVTDAEVQNGTVLSGTMKSIDRFLLDSKLNYANLTSEESVLAEQGSYLYLDFWVVSPGSDFTLRVSTGEDEGTFVIGLPEAEETEDGYRLENASESASASVRLGFLANPNELWDNTMLYYQSSAGFSDQYTRLRGAYTEPGNVATYGDYHFCIYEPNGDYHPDESVAEDGTYVLTWPIGLADDGAALTDIQENLTVQLRNRWLAGMANTAGTQLEQRFQAAILEPSFQDLTAQEITGRFYSEYLGNQVAPYVEPGQFLKSSANLYNAAADGAAEEQYLTGAFTAGATEDAYIVKLIKNVPQRIRLFIWLEGQDVDCVNSAEASSLAVNIELAGSNANE